MVNYFAKSRNTTGQKLLNNIDYVIQNHIVMDEKDITNLFSLLYSKIKYVCNHENISEILDDILKYYNDNYDILSHNAIRTIFEFLINIYKHHHVCFCGGHGFIYIIVIKNKYVLLNDEIDLLQNTSYILIDTIKLLCDDYDIQNEMLDLYFNNYSNIKKIAQSNEIISILKKAKHVFSRNTVKIIFKQAYIHRENDSMKIYEIFELFNKFEYNITIDDLFDYYSSNMKWKWKCVSNKMNECFRCSFINIILAEYKNRKLCCKLNDFVNVCCNKNITGHIFDYILDNDIIEDINSDISENKIMNIIKCNLFDITKLLKIKNIKITENMMKLFIQLNGISAIEKCINDNSILLLDMNYIFKYACLNDNIKLVEYCLNQKYMPDDKMLYYVFISKMRCKIIEFFNNYGYVKTSHYNNMYYICTNIIPYYNKYQVKKIISNNIVEGNLKYDCLNSKLETILSNNDQEFDDECFMLSVLNENHAVFEYFYDTYNYIPDITTIMMISDFSIRYLMMMRFTNLNLRKFMD